MKQKLILFALLMFSFIGYSQIIGMDADIEDERVNERRLTDAEFERAKKLHFKMLNSKDNKKKDEIYKELHLILGEWSGFRSFLDGEDVDSIKIKNWVAKKVEDKKNRKRVEKLLSKLIITEDRIMKDNAEEMGLWLKASGYEKQEIYRFATKKLKSNKK